MSFYLKGIFTPDTDEKIVIEARNRWPNIRSKKISGKIGGLGIVGPNENNADTNEEYQKFQEINYKMEDELPDFSRQFPNSKFAFISVDCWGGFCLYSGYICLNGQKTIDLSEQFDEDAGQEKQKEKLKTLLTKIGIDLDDSGYFEPFTRSYFD